MSRDAPAIWLAYKRPGDTALMFAGILFVCLKDGSCAAWGVVARDRVVTGVREAVGLAQLLVAGKLIIEQNEGS